VGAQRKREHFPVCRSVDETAPRVSSHAACLRKETRLRIGLSM
jgi:hypothetical protein